MFATPADPSLSMQDKNGINYASAYDLETGTNLHGQVREIDVHPLARPGGN
jgi:hypothetical protein